MGDKKKKCIISASLSERRLERDLPPESEEGEIRFYNCRPHLTIPFSYRPLSSRLLSTPISLHYNCRNCQDSLAKFFSELVRVGVKIPQDGNRANVYGQVTMVHGHVWRTVCSVCATGARVARPVPCNS